MLCVQCEADKYFTHTVGNHNMGRCFAGDPEHDYPVVLVPTMAGPVLCATAVLGRPDTRDLALAAVESGDPAHIRLLARHGEAIHRYPL